jgi:uncharacterized membrane protein YccC
MFEVIALLAGAALGAGVANARRRWVMIGAGALVIGVSVAAVSGELAESWGFAVFDTVQAAVGATCTSLLVAALARRRRLTG